MVQRKAPTKLASPMDSKNNYVKPERDRPAPHQQEARSKGGGDDLKKRMKKLRSIRASGLAGLEVQKDPQSSEPARIGDGSPNYMKPTSSWDARRGRRQVTIHSVSAIDQNQNPKNSNSLKILSRKSSLNRARPSMKKASEVALYPKEVTRATCSSTLKDSKFPMALDLSPGGTEAEGTSIMKVCPYTYCSLNGHRHPPLPPLKCFMSARRKSLKTQKSLKLKGWLPFRGKGIDTGQRECASTDPSGFEITPLGMMDEVVDDFFVEIYAKPQGHTIEGKNCDERTIWEDDGPERSDGLSLIQDCRDCAESGVEEDSARDVLNQIEESSSDTGFDDDPVSIEEMDAMELVEGDGQIESTEENDSNLVGEICAEWCFDCVFDVLGKGDECLGGNGRNISICGTTNIGSEKETFQSDDVLIPTSLNLPGTDTTEDFAFETDVCVCIAEELLEVYDDGNSQSCVVDSNDAIERSGSNTSLSLFEKTSDACDDPDCNELSNGYGQNLKPLMPELLHENKVVVGSIFKESGGGFLSCEEEASGFFVAERFKTVDMEAMQDLEHESLEHSIDSDVIQEENWDEVEKEYKCGETIIDPNIIPGIHTDEFDSENSHKKQEQEEVIERKVGITFEDVVESEENKTMSNDGCNQNPKPLDFSEEDDLVNEFNTVESEPRSSEEEIDGSSFLGWDEVISDIFEGEGFEAVDIEPMKNGSSVHSVLIDVIQEVNGDEEAEDTEGYKNEGATVEQNIPLIQSSTTNEWVSEISQKEQEQEEATEIKGRIEVNSVIRIEYGVGIDEDHITLNDGFDQNPEPFDISDENGQIDECKITGSEPCSSEENVCDSCFHRCDQVISDIFEGEIFETVGIEEMEDSDSESIEHLVLSDSIEEAQNGDEEVEAIRIELETKECKHDKGTEGQNITGIKSSATDKPDQENSPKEQEEEEAGEAKGSIKIDGMIQIENNVKFDADQIYHSFSNLEDDEKTKARMVVVRKRAVEESEQAKDFNPRSPRFLPIEPDPEAEKVDLRHQTIDERKNSEEWMVDYALRQAVTKLGPARKKKVALLVEAFETVTPLPMYQGTLRHTAPGFANSRPMQACRHGAKDDNCVNASANQRASMTTGTHLLPL